MAEDVKGGPGDVASLWRIHALRQGRRIGGQENHRWCCHFLIEPALLLPGWRAQDEIEGDAWFLRDITKERSADCGRPSKLTNFGAQLPVFNRCTDGYTTDESPFSVDWQTGGAEKGPHEPSHKGGRKARPGTLASRRKKAPMARIRADPIQNFLSGLLTRGLMFVWPGLATVATIGNIGSSWARRVLGTKELELTPEMGGVDAPGSERRPQKYVDTYQYMN